MNMLKKYNNSVLGFNQKSRTIRRFVHTHTHTIMDLLHAVTGASYRVPGGLFSSHLLLEFWSSQEDGCKVEECKNKTKATGMCCRTQEDWLKHISSPYLWCWCPAGEAGTLFTQLNTGQGYLRSQKSREGESLHVWLLPHIHQQVQPQRSENIRATK